MATDKRIEDYLHLYLGCEVACIGKPTEELNTIVLNEIIDGDFKNMKWSPILSPLSDMSEEEMNFLEKIENDILVMEWDDNRRVEAAKTKYLLSKHFDLFGLIEAGLAIDKTEKNIEDNWDDYCEKAAE